MANGVGGVEMVIPEAVAEVLEKLAREHGVLMSWRANDRHGQHDLALRLGPGGFASDITWSCTWQVGVYGMRESSAYHLPLRGATLQAFDAGLLAAIATAQDKQQEAKRMRAPVRKAHATKEAEQLLAKCVASKEALRKVAELWPDPAAATPPGDGSVM